MDEKSERVFLSIFAATCRPTNIITFLDNLKDTCDDPASFEVLLKVDNDADELITLIERYQETSSFIIKYLATPKLDGYYSLHHGYSELLKVADPDTYFCWLLTDEIRFDSKGWDTVLKQYIGLYQDDIFRLKLSVFALKNYHDFYECLPCPDNYAVTTRAWLEITGGWGDFWGPDSWHQCIDYFLGLCRTTGNPYGIWRSVPIQGISVGGQEAGQGIIDQESLYKRHVNIHAGWKFHSTHYAQENFNRLAKRLMMHLTASEIGLNEYIIEEQLITKCIKLVNPDTKACVRKEKYALPWLSLRLCLGNKQILIKQVPSLLLINIKRYLIKKKRSILINIKSSRMDLEAASSRGVYLSFAWLLVPSSLRMRMKLFNDITKNKIRSMHNCVIRILSFESAYKKASKIRQYARSHSVLGYMFIYIMMKIASLPCRTYVILASVARKIWLLNFRLLLRVPQYFVICCIYFFRSSIRSFQYVMTYFFKKKSQTKPFLRIRYFYDGNHFTEIN